MYLHFTHELSGSVLKWIGYVFKYLQYTVEPMLFLFIEIMKKIFQDRFPEKNLNLEGLNKLWFRQQQNEL